MGHLADRAAALLVVDARMRGPALNLQAQHAGAFARGNAFSRIGACGLAHQRIAGIPGETFDRCARPVTARFFVGHQQEINRQRGGTGCGQLTQGGECQVNAALHIVRAGAVQFVALDPALVLLQGAIGMHRIQMGQDENAGAAIARGPVADVQQRAGRVSE
jgi:hypothetical protein